ncbi:hypothetical protein CPB83DRAFT_897004 [Crepidotus variabilis]|uniref:Uncharacterized protein n=1 Tax=Crepidotus variabilis TaxID=179855 RepID=A0A9P6EAF0_9AGAR|nr:hypothetical protein CPB83DRAFT_897004 [Crepidotus variabilis]
MAPSSTLLSALGLSEPCNDEEITTTLVALLTSAAHDTKPVKNFHELYKLMTSEGESTYLDPLDMLPILLPCSDPAAAEIVSLIGECGSAKEVVIAAQEAAERLRRSFELDGEDEENQDAQPIDDYENQSRQLFALINLYSSAISRLKLRRKSPSETIRPLLKELESLLSVSAPFLKVNHTRMTLSLCVELVLVCHKWAMSVDSVADGIKDTRAILKSLVDLLALSHVLNIQASIAQRTFEECFPRLVFRSSLLDGWKDGDEVVGKLLDSYQTLEVNLYDSKSQVSSSHLIAAAYRPPSDLSPLPLLTFLLPILISSIQTNTLLDESLAVLLRSLHSWRSNTPTNSLPQEITAPLMNVLPAIASIHPDPQTRHQTFRTLFLLLASSDDKLRFQHLVELAGHSEFPQMRVAAIGLVKENVLQALGVATIAEKSNDPLVGPLFMRTFGPILFRPNPPQLFDDETLEMGEFQESPEPARLVECLSFYYVLMQRDTKNLTGINDKDMFKTIDANLLAPLRRNISRWMDEGPSATQGHLHISSLVSLRISLERIDSAREGLAK